MVEGQGQVGWDLEEELFSDLPPLHQYKEVQYPEDGQMQPQQYAEIHEA